MSAKSPIGRAFYPLYIEAKKRIKNNSIYLGEKL